MMHVFGQCITELASSCVCLCAIIAFGVDEVLGQATLPTSHAVRLILHISSSSYLFLKLRQRHVLGRMKPNCALNESAPFSPFSAEEDFNLILCIVELC